MIGLLIDWQAESCSWRRSGSELPRLALDRRHCCGENPHFLSLIVFFFLLLFSSRQKEFISIFIDCHNQTHFQNQQILRVLLLLLLTPQYAISVVFGLIVLMPFWTPLWMPIAARLFGNNNNKTTDSPASSAPSDAKTGQIMKGWFSEVCASWPGQAMSLEIDKVN
jgi:hypothetical protein